MNEYNADTLVDKYTGKAFYFFDWFGGSGYRYVFIEEFSLLDEFIARIFLL